jgi:ABC-type transporter lipoprotein component MlaA
MDINYIQAIREIDNLLWRARMEEIAGNSDESYSKFREAVYELVKLDTQVQRQRISKNDEKQIAEGLDTVLPAGQEI